MSVETKEQATWVEDCLLREYTLQQILSQTPTGEVSLWQHNALKKKLILRRCLADQEVYQRMLGVIHPNLPQIYETFASDGKMLVLEEYIEGVLLSEKAAQLVGKKGLVRQIGLNLCDAVNCLHQRGIIHRDIKPENIILESSSNRLVLIDYTAARCKRLSDLGSPDTICLGTAPYAAPEQFGVTQTDERTDIYAIGILLNILMTGHHPSQIICRGGLGRIIRHCICINTSERYPSVQQLKNALWNL